MEYLVYPVSQYSLGFSREGDLRGDICLFLASLRSLQEGEDPKMIFYFLRSTRP